MFKVGDMVECIEEHQYVDVGAIGKIIIIDLNANGEGPVILCKWISGEFIIDDGASDTNGEWWISQNKIKLVVPNIDTLIKRVNIGHLAQKQLEENYLNQYRAYYDSDINLVTTEKRS